MEDIEALRRENEVNVETRKREQQTGGGTEGQVRGEREYHSGVHALDADDLSTRGKRAHGTM